MIVFVATRKLFTFALIGFLASALVFWLLPFRSEGATVTSRSDTISDSRPSAAANHTVAFTTTSSDDIVAGETVVIDFGGSSDVFDLSSIAVGDIDFEVGGTDHNLVAVGSCGAPANELEAAINTTSDTITFTRCASDATIAGGSAISVKVGTNTDVPSAGTNQITNPSSAAVQDVTVAGTFQTSQVTSTIKVAIISGVTVTATVSETLTFTIAGVTNSSCTTPAGGTDVTTTATAIDYSSIGAEAFFDGCQDLTVATNAPGGYSTTVKLLDELSLNSAAGTEIGEGSCDGSCTTTSGAAWGTNTNNGFAYCMQDTTGTGAANAGWVAADQCNDATPFFRLHAINPGAETGSSNQTPVNVIQASAPSSHTAQIAHRLSVDTTQAAGPYTATIVYVTTPTY